MIQSFLTKLKSEHNKELKQVETPGSILVWKQWENVVRMYEFNKKSVENIINEIMWEKKDKNIY